MATKETYIMKLRTVCALQAVKRYPAYSRADLQGSIVDLITDCLHLARKKNLDYAEVVESAIQHYAAEVRAKF
jgi:hypothetical protein